MKTTKRILSGILAAVSVFSFTACGKDEESSSAPVTLDSEQQQIVEDVASTLPDVELANKTVKWLAHYDCNPSDEKTKDAGIAMFEEKYGGKVEWISTTFETRYTDLANYVAGNQSPDIFPSGDMDAFPKGAIKNMFQPIDDYVDFSLDHWAEMSATNDALMFQGKHYIAGVSVSPNNICIYNRNVIAANGFEDPVDLLDRGEWDWNTFEEMCLAFTNPDEDKYALDGWATENAILNSAGVPLITLEDGKIVSNMNSPTVEKVMTFMYELQKNTVLYPRHLINNWSIRGGKDGVGMKEGNLLFLPIGIWALETTDTAHLGDVANGDIMFVPMPKDPDLDYYPIWSRVDGFLLIQGAPNPEGAGVYINCVMVGNSDEATKKMGEQQLMDDYGWTQEMIDMKYRIIDLAEEHAIFDFSNGVTDKIASTLDQVSRSTMIPGETTWAETRTTYADAIQMLVDEANAAIAG